MNGLNLFQQYLTKDGEWVSLNTLIATSTTLKTYYEVLDKAKQMNNTDLIKEVIRNIGNEIDCHQTRWVAADSLLGCVLSHPTASATHPYGQTIAPSGSNS